MRQTLVLTGCVLLAISGCQKAEPVKTSGMDTIAKDILTAIGNGQADKVFDVYFTPEYRKELPREEFAAMVEAYKQKLGAFKSLKPLPNMTNTTRIGDYVDGSFGFDVKWEKATGLVILNMSMREKWLVANIQIQSTVFNDKLKQPGLNKGATETQNTPVVGK
jgi:hypothetical protein